MLAPAAREELLGEIAKAVDGQGGGFNVDYETHLYIARRVFGPLKWPIRRPTLRLSQCTRAALFPAVCFCGDPDTGLKYVFRAVKMTALRRSSIVRRTS